nr:MAG TPA: hypothetical protein [Caudoviricetes sp.]
MTMAILRILNFTSSSLMRFCIFSINSCSFIFGLFLS